MNVRVIAICLLILALAVIWSPRWDRSSQSVEAIPQVFTVTEHDTSNGLILWEVNDAVSGGRFIVVRNRMSSNSIAIIRADPLDIPSSPTPSPSARAGSPAASGYRSPSGH